MQEQEQNPNLNPEVGKLVYLQLTGTNRQGQRYQRTLAGKLLQVGEAALVIEAPPEPQVAFGERKPKVYVVQKELIRGLVLEDDRAAVETEALKGQYHLHLSREPSYATREDGVASNTGSQAYFSRCFNGVFRMIYFEDPERVLYHRQGQVLLSEARQAGYEITSWGLEAPNLP